MCWRGVCGAVRLRHWLWLVRGFTLFSSQSNSRSDSRRGGDSALSVCVLCGVGGKVLLVFLYKRGRKFDGRDVISGEKVCHHFSLFL